MGKRLEAKITCPSCGSKFDFTLYRTIWGEYPENRELVMSDKITPLPVFSPVALNA